MTEKFYVVVECGWEYNDERMYKPESSGGMPVKVYTEEAVADEVCRELTFKEIKRLGNGGYWGCGLGEYMSEDGIGDLFTEKGIELLVEFNVYDSAEDAHDDWHGVKLSFKGLSDDQIRQLAAELGQYSQFYEVVEVEQ